MNIDYQLVASAIDFYRQNNFTYVEAPWIVNEASVKMTCPPNKCAIKAFHPIHEYGYLVGSAEQSFIQLMLNKQIANGKYVAAGPCFRDDIVDNLHQTTFFKVELIDIGDSDHSLELMDMVKKFLKQITAMSIQSIKTKEGYDLNLNNIEIGSYGFRRHKNLSWTYGTGIALPRFSIANNVQ